MTDNQPLPGNPYVDDTTVYHDVNGDLANAILAIAYEQRETSTLLRTYLDSVNPPTSGGDQPAQEEINWDEQITSLAATLWNADPKNDGNPAGRFENDYATSQDRYLTMARAALGLQDEPRKKDSRRP